MYLINNIQKNYMYLINNIQKNYQKQFVVRKKKNYLKFKLFVRKM